MHVYTDAVTSAPVLKITERKIRLMFVTWWLRPPANSFHSFFHLFLTRIIALASPLTATAVDQAVRFLRPFRHSSWRSAYRTGCFRITVPLLLLLHISCRPFSYISVYCISALEANHWLCMVRRMMALRPFVCRVRREADYATIFFGRLLTYFK